MRHHQEAELVPETETEAALRVVVISQQQKNKLRADR